MATKYCPSDHCDAEYCNDDNCTKPHWHAFNCYCSECATMDDDD